MDGRLPFLDGLEATRCIRENGLRDQVKILALNGSGSPRYHAEALAAGCDDSIEKPFDLDRLRRYLFCSSILPLMPGSKGNCLASQQVTAPASCCFLYSNNESHLHARAAGRQVRFVIFLILRN